MKELEDYKWFPKMLRQYQTDYIGFVAGMSGIYKPFIGHLQKKVKSDGSMYDVCSGSGEPAISIYRNSRAFNRLTLSDKYPLSNFSNRDASIRYEHSSVDAGTIHFDTDSTYTMFNAFHHFSVEEQVGMVRQIQDANAEAFFVEILEPRPLCLLKIILGTTIGPFLFMPFVKPFSLGRIFFTYIIPVNIFTILYDGIISVLKSKTQNHYRNLLSPFSRAEVKRFRSMAGPTIMIHIKPA